ncbi:VanZ family protein [Candidatus Enterococcus ferrettii]|uniref:VanZ/RDD domain-containing protein n=1 Tax=Candidatus Enterococcus ferrettii TaxID=2815324 RepID=A0ABV0ERQ2_9ENTE|nr:VanZ family protein [Enterococcus sp. 665A]MBO1340735.1 VanZ family protein [Enterococcus sp. 665A]
MSSYVFPIKTALAFFPLLALLITAPFLIYYYRKYGTLGKKRSLILYSFVFYLLCAYFLVILPLPSIQEVAAMTGPKYNLHLFQSWQNFTSQTVLRINEPSTYLPAMRQGVFLEPVFNILLLFPFGVYCRYYFRFSWKKTIAASFFLSLFFELTQLSGLYFIYPRPYRLFDVNDLLHNTLGGTFGYICAPLFTFFLPTRSELDEESLEKGHKVTLLRRAVAAVIDWFVIDLTTGLVQIVLALFPATSFLADTVKLRYHLGWFTLEVVVYFMILMYFWQGQTVGKKVVRIKVEETGRPRVRFISLVKRYSFFYLLMFIINQIFQFSVTHLNSTNHVLFIAYSILALISFGILLLFVFNLLYALIRRSPRLFHEKASRTYTRSTLEKKEVEHGNI